MKSLVYLGPGKMQIQEMVKPNDEIIIQIHGSGICGTDLKTYLYGHHMFTPPTILGHECFGKVVKAPETSEFRINDSVVIAPYIECGECEMCRKGFGEMCKNKSYGDGGCFCEYMGLNEVLAQKLLFKVDKLMDEYALVEPIACVLTSMEKLSYPYRNALVVGGGPMGCLYAATLQHSGAEVTVIETSEYRTDYLKNIGMNAMAPEQLGDEKYDLIVLAVNKPDLIDIYAEKVADCGDLVLFSGYPKEENGIFKLYHIHYRQIRISGTTGYKMNNFISALKMVEENREFFKKTISHAFSLDNAMTAFDKLEKGKCMKAIVRMV